MGEDRPEEIKNFVEHIKFNPHRTIVGERVKDLKVYFLSFVIASIKS